MIHRHPFRTGEYIPVVCISCAQTETSIPYSSSFLFFLRLFPLAPAAHSFHPFCCDRLWALRLLALLPLQLLSLVPSPKPKLHCHLLHPHLHLFPQYLPLLPCLLHPHLPLHTSNSCPPMSRTLILKAQTGPSSRPISRMPWRLHAGGATLMAQNHALSPKTSPTRWTQR